MNVGEKSGVVTIAIGVLYSILSLNMDRATIGNPVEPMIFPLVLGALMILCGIILFIMQHRKAAQAEKKVDSPKGPFWTFEVKMVIFICTVSVLYGLLFERIGYVLSTTLFLGALLLSFSGWKKWISNLIIAFGFSVAIYYCFSEILSIPLPKVPFLNI